MSVTFSYDKERDSWVYGNTYIPRSFMDSHTENEIQDFIKDKIKISFPLDIISMMKNYEN